MPTRTPTRPVVAVLSLVAALCDAAEVGLEKTGYPAKSTRVPAHRRQPRFRAVGLPAPSAYGDPVEICPVNWGNSSLQCARRVMHKMCCTGFPIFLVKCNAGWFLWYFSAVSG